MNRRAFMQTMLALACAPAFARVAAKDIVVARFDDLTVTLPRPLLGARPFIIRNTSDRMITIHAPYETIHRPPAHVWTETECIICDGEEWHRVYRRESCPHRLK